MSRHAMPGSGWTLHVLDGRQTVAREAELIALRDEVFGSGDADFARRLGVWRR